MSSKIKILDESLAEPVTISAASSAVRTEKINSDNLLSFSILVSSGLAGYITDSSVFELDNDYFDVAYYKKEQQGDGRLMVSVEAEHISYRLNHPDFNVEYFTETGTPTEILTAILSGTGFVAGVIDFTEQATFSLQECASRRRLLMQFAEYLGGELAFDGLTISILSQRGSATPKALTVGKDLTVISKSVDKRKLDEAGTPTIAYTCGVYKGAEIALGDVITLDYDALDIDISLRVVSKAFDPYNPNNVTVEIGNYANSLEDDLYRIETQAVSKDTLMNGCRIGPEYGFEAVRNDKKARAYFRSDGMAMQSGDGSGGNWTDRLKYEYDDETDETTLVFYGKLSASLIEALSVLISPNLYAGKATIAEVTVDQLDTSDKVQKYLDEDKSDDNFQRIYDQYHEFITASVCGLYGAEATGTGIWDLTQNPEEDAYYSSVSVNSATGAITFSGASGVINALAAYAGGYVYRAKDDSSYYILTDATDTTVDYAVYTVVVTDPTSVQATDRNGDLLYWTDDTHEAATTEETEYPVYVYEYTEASKLKIGFREDPVSGFYIPMIILGIGSGTDDNGKGFIYKGVDGLYIDYYRAVDGAVRRILLCDTGIILTPYDLQSLDFWDNGFSAVYSGEAVAYTWTLDSNGVITELITEDNVTIPVTWHTGDM